MAANTVATPHSHAAPETLGAALPLQSRADAAIVSLTTAVRLQPDSAQSHYLMGVSQRRSDDFEAAIASCKRAIELEPDHAMAYFTMGTDYAAMGELGKTESALRKVLRLDPDNAILRSDAESGLQQVRQFLQNQKENPPSP